MRNVTALALVRNIHEARCACAWLDFLRKTNKKPAGDIVCKTEILAALNFRRFQPIQAIINLNQHHQLVANTSLVTNISLKQPHIIGSPQNLDAQVTTQHTQLAPHHHRDHQHTGAPDSTFHQPNVDYPSDDRHFRHPQ